MSDFAELERRVEWLSAEARASQDPRLRSKIEFTLSEGYVHALAAEAEMRRLDRRLDALLDAVDAERAGELRSVATERRLLAERIERLRAGLATLREGFVALSQR